MTTLATDDFNRANAANLGANWTIFDAALPIVSNQVTRPGVGAASELYNAVTPPADQWAQIVIKALCDTSDEGMGPCVRMNGTNLYFVQTNAVETRIYKRISGTYTQLGADGVACAVNDVLYLEVQGNALIAKKNGTAIITTTDPASAIASGSAGLWATAAGSVTTAGDDFAFGDFSGGAIIEDVSDWPLVAAPWPEQWRMTVCL